MTAFLAALLAFAVQAGAPSSGAPLRTIAKGDQSSIEDARQVVARTPAEWQALWRKHDAERRPPAVDFSKEIVVAVFLGSRPTAGWILEIVSATLEGDALVVRYREAAPASGAVTAQVITSCFHIVALPKTSATVRFEKVKTEK